MAIPNALPGWAAAQLFLFHQDYLPLSCFVPRLWLFGSPSYKKES
jgi:hypothetical protein